MAKNFLSFFLIIFLGISLSVPQLHAMNQEFQEGEDALWQDVERVLGKSFSESKNDDGDVQAQLTEEEHQQLLEIAQVHRDLFVTFVSIADCVPLWLVRALRSEEMQELLRFAPRAALFYLCVFSAIALNEWVASSVGNV